MPEIVYRVSGRSSVKPGNLPEGLEVKEVEKAIIRSIETTQEHKQLSVVEHTREKVLIVGRPSHDVVVLNVEQAKQLRDVADLFIRSNTEPATLIQNVERSLNSRRGYRMF
jgi:hypothetical protein